MQIQLSFSIFAYNQTNERMKYIKWRHFEGDRRTPEQIRRDDRRMTWALILAKICVFSLILFVICICFRFITVGAYSMAAFFISGGIALWLAIGAAGDFLTINGTRGGNPWDEHLEF